MNETNTQRRRNRAKNTQRRRCKRQEHHILAPLLRTRLLSIGRVPSRDGAKRTEFPSRAATNGIHFEIRFEVIHRQTVTSHRRFSVVVLIAVDGVGDVSVRVLEDFSYALRDLRIIIRLIKLLTFRKGIFEFVRHVVQNGTTLTLKDKRLIEQSNTEMILKANEKRRSLPLFCLSSSFAFALACFIKCVCV